jgi:hypothetical protein
MKEFAGRYTAARCSKDAANVAAFYSAAGSLRVTTVLRLSVVMP